MQIIATNKELDKKDIYFLTKANNTQKMSDATGQTLEASIWALYEDANSDGEVHTIFSMKTPEGEIYATNSESFVRSINDMLDVFDPDEIEKIQVIANKSKNNRTFLTAAFVE